MRGGLTTRFRAWRRRRVARTTRHTTPGLPDTSIDRVSVAYEPVRDGDPDPGEVVWAWVPYDEDHTTGKDRPVVVIGRSGDHLAGIQLTTKGHDHPDNVLVGAGDWDPQRRDSWAKLDRIVQIDPATARRVDAVLDRARFDALVAAARRAGHHV